MQISREAFWLWAVMIFGVGSKRLWEMSDNFDNISCFYKALIDHAITSVTQSEYERVDSVKLEDAESVLEKCRESGQKYLCYESEGYPQRLKTIANPPAMLFYRGSLDFLNDRCLLTAVGTRHASQYSLDTTERLCGELVERNFLIATGFAEGIDQCANLVSLQKKAPTLAVCATPIDYDYPKGSLELKKTIAQTGAVISEYYPGAKFQSGSFSARNRISVGLSDGVIFIEAGRDSHGLDNYTHAVYQGKPVFVVPPHDIYDKRYFGQRDLIRNECQTIFGADDVVYALADGKYYDLKYVRSLGIFNLPAEDSGFFNYENEVKPQKKKSKSAAKRSVNSAKKAPQSKADAPQTAVDYSQLDDASSCVCRLLEKGAMLADEIASAAQMEISEVFSVLTELEMEQIIESLPGKLYGLK